MSYLADIDNEKWHWKDRPYKVGFWNNWSKDGAQALTLTMLSGHGKILLTVVTLFITVVAGHTWDIVCFVAHQVLSSDKSLDGLHHQRQAILRNSRPPSSTLWYLLKLGWYWRGRTNRPWRRSLPVVLIDILHIICFVGAAIAAVQIVYTGNDVLIKPRKCGGFMTDLTDPTSDVQFRSRIQSEIRKSMQRSVEYVRNCYDETEEAEKPECEQDCKLFATKSLPLDIKSGVDCPISPHFLCRNSTAGTVHVQSAMLDSHIHFGINGRRSDRVQFGRAAVCSPLPYTENATFVERKPLRGYGTPEEQPGLFNITINYVMPPFSTWIDETSGGSGGEQPYTVWAATHSPGRPIISTRGAKLELVEELRTRNADLTLGIVTTRAMYLQPSNDVLLGTKYSLREEECLCNNIPAGTGTAYFAQVASPFFCAEKVQFCNPTTERCTDWDSLNNLLSASEEKVPRLSLLADIGLNARQNETVSLIGLAYDDASLTMVLNSISGSSMLAQNLFLSNVGTMSLAVAPNQWEMEIEHWFQIQLAHLQRTFVERLHPPPDMDAFFIDATDSETLALCGSQIVHQADYQSYNVLGLILILVWGLILIVTSLSLPSLVRWWRRRKDTGEYKQIEWDMGELLHIQRTAFEALGQGSWNLEYNLVPTTEEYGEPLTFPRNATDTTDGCTSNLLKSVQSRQSAAESDEASP